MGVVTHAASGDCGDVVCQLDRREEGIGLTDGGLQGVTGVPFAVFACLGTGKSTGRFAQQL